LNLEVIPVKIKQEVQKGDNIAKLIMSSKKLQDGDIIVIAQKIVSKQEGRVVSLDGVIPSVLALGIASEYDKSPQIIETILSESKRIVRMNNGIIIVETKHGFICANAGVDESNIEPGFATLLPIDPDKSAATLHEEIQKESGKKVAVLISDTFGRPFRMGQTNAAIGLSGMESIIDYEGTKDTFGKILRVTEIAIADELCAAAEITMGKASKIPVAIIRNYKLDSVSSNAKNLIRPKVEDLFS